MLSKMYLFKIGENDKSFKQAGAELCQAQVKLGLAKIHICVQN